MSLNLESFNEKPKNKRTKYKAALGVGSAVGLLGIGSTLAANISLNGGGNVEFGQGVATTAACDEDGFSITPVTYFDNDNEIFRVDNIEISGLDLTPEGSKATQLSYDELGITDRNADASIDQADAKLQYPGQYFDGTDWKRTCDNVVIDFKAYTSDPAYAKYTDDAYANPNNTSITSPVAWSQYFNNGELNGIYGPGFAAIFDAFDDGSDYNYNFGVDAVDVNNPNSWHGESGLNYLGVPDQSTLTTSNAEFQIRWNNSSEPNAASISKITVQSMSEFPYTYETWNNEGLGNPSYSNWPTFND